MVRVVYENYYLKVYVFFGKSDAAEGNSLGAIFRALIAKKRNEEPLFKLIFLCITRTNSCDTMANKWPAKLGEGGDFQIL